MACCCERKGNLRKCIPIYVVGGVLLIAGLPLMIVGIVGQFVIADLLGYAGGILILFGIGFLIIWHMFTIKNLNKVPIDDDDFQEIQEVLKSRVRLSMSSSMNFNLQNNTGHMNAAYASEKRQLPGASAYVDQNEYMPDGIVFKESKNNSNSNLNESTCAYDNPTLKYEDEARYDAEDYETKVNLATISNSIGNLEITHDSTSSLASSSR